jgi:CIC family chloride channel protein
VGREGPIIQIGASFASTTGRLSGASQWQRATLVAAGGGAGIAATFNTPIGGVLFAVEILLHEVSARTLVPLALATTTATFVGRSLFGNTPAFAIPRLSIAESDTVGTLFAAVVLGVVMALMSVAFIRFLYGTEDLFEKRIPKNDYIRHGVGMLVVGVLFEGLLVFKGHYYVQGVGYATIMDVLSGTPISVWFLVLLAFLKLATTCLTLGSGGSGGVFSPSLFMGATLGVAYGIAFCKLFPHVNVDPRVFALVGMSALVAGATGAALTAIVMIFEMTLDYTVVLPLTLAAAVSYGLRRALLADSIYTLKLARRGHVMPGALQANAHLVHQIADIAMAGVTVYSADASPGTLNFGDESAPSHIAVVRNDTVIGVVARDWALGHAALLQQAQKLQEVAQSDFIVMPSDDTVFDLIAAMQKARASLAVIVAPASREAASSLPVAPQILGIVTKANLVEALAEGMELFED